MDQDVIQKRLQIIEELQEELNILKDAYDEALENDADYQEVVEEERKAKDEAKVKKTKVLANDDYLKLAEDVKDKRREIKENKEALSLDLVDYYKQNGSIEIVDHNGNVKRMKFSVSLTN